MKDRMSDSNIQEQGTRQSENKGLSRRGFLKILGMGAGLGAAAVVAPNLAARAASSRPEDSRQLVANPENALGELNSPADVFEGFQGWMEKSVSEGSNAPTSTELVGILAGLTVNELNNVRYSTEGSEKFVSNSKQEKPGFFDSPYSSIFWSMVLTDGIKSATVNVQLAQGSVDIAVEGAALSGMFPELASLKKYEGVPTEEKLTSVHHRGYKEKLINDMLGDGQAALITDNGDAKAEVLRVFTQLLSTDFYEKHASEVDVYTQTDYVNPELKNGGRVSLGTDLDQVFKDAMGDKDVPMYIVGAENDYKAATFTCKFIGEGDDRQTSATCVTGIEAGVISFSDNGPDTTSLLLAEKNSTTIVTQKGRSSNTTYDIKGDVFSDRDDYLRGLGIDPDKLRQNTQRYLDGIKSNMYANARDVYNNVTNQLKQKGIPTYPLDSATSQQDIVEPPQSA